MKGRRRWIPALCAAAVLCLAAGLVMRPVTVLLEPLQTACAAAADWLDTELFAGHWERQWEQSRQELLSLRTQAARADALEEENAFLREFLELKETRADIQLTAARVITAAAEDPYYGFCINVGTLDGVEAGDPVLSEDGLAGIVSRAGANWATVRSVYHPQVTVSVCISPTGDYGETRAGEDTLLVSTLPRSCDAAAGDLVVTSGLGGVYPAGIPVGTVGTPAPDPDGVTMNAALTPLFIPGETRQVMVMTDFADKME